jgi:hypothetical protein
MGPDRSRIPANGQASLRLSPIERVALEAIREERPETVATFSAWVAEALDDLAQTSQGRVVTEAEADDLLIRFCGEAVRRMLAEMAPWGVDVQRVVGTARH